MRSSLAEILQIVFRNFVGIGAERRERESAFLGREGEGIHLDGIEKIFTALLAGEEIVDPGDKGIAAELEGVAAGIEAESFGDVQAVLTGSARQYVRAADGVDDG